MPGNSKKAIRTKIEDGDRAVIMDFENLSYISSAGLRAVLMTAKNLWKRDAKFRALLALGPGQGSVRDQRLRQDHPDPRFPGSSAELTRRLDTARRRAISPSAVTIPEEERATPPARSMRAVHVLHVLKQVKLSARIDRSGCRGRDRGRRIRRGRLKGRSNVSRDCPDQIPEPRVGQRQQCTTSRTETPLRQCVGTARPCA